MAMTRSSEENRRKIEALREALIEGEQSGAAGAFDVEAFIERKRSRVPRSTVKAKRD